MIKATTTIVNKLGLHARAATKFASTANLFASNIAVQCNAKSVDGKSVMSLMLLAAAKGTELEIAVTGDDQEQALRALLELIADKFGEDS
jgi:phosphocarrier protein HPr